MPDWTYHPLRGAAATLLGARRSQRAALRMLGRLSARPLGRRLVAGAFGHRPPPAELAGAAAGLDLANRLGAEVPPEVARDAVRALPTQGAGLVVVTPVGPSEVDAVREAAAGRRVPVLVLTGDPAVSAALAPHVDAVLADDDDLVRLSSPLVADAVAALAADPVKAVVARPSVLLAAGPGWFQRVAEAVTPTSPPPNPRADVGRDPRRWPAWWWGLCVGLGMVGAGLGAAAITLGPVLLWYDRDFLGLDRDHLHGVNHHLVSFLQHDRITMAATMVAIGILYAGLAAGGIRQGWPWARNALLASGLIGFPTLLYFLATGFVEPLHTAVAAVLFPMFVAAVWRAPGQPRWRILPDGPEHERRRALTGQLLMILTGAGLFIGGAVVSVVGLTEVFVPSDLAFLGTTSDELENANPRLLAFIAHDRAGFGGALMAAAVAIVLVSAWGWRRGAGWVWWSLAASAACGFVPPVVVHAHITYTDFWHLAPVYFGMLLTTVALYLSRPYLCARPNSPGRQAGG
ncbi:hypothetical protein [Yinghuangia sp. YIM S09857]|uniref:hypothetical protein n=1 Tax=Yinghuangia sp. YIM S09857 TaxID=3436929 RepID=UPI003F52C805